MNIYIAAPFKEKAAAREFRGLAEAAGHTSTAQWIDKHNKEFGELGPAELRDEAWVDISDIARADALVLLNDFPCSAGRMFEWGYAWATDKPVIIIGEGVYSVFSHLPGVTMVATAEEALAELRKVELYGTWS